MTLHKTLLSVFAVAAALASCSSDKTDPDPVPAGPATVEKFLSPKDGLSVNTLLLDPDGFEGLLFEWAPPKGDDLKYELVFDLADGDFSAPVETIETTEPRYMLSLSELQQLFDLHKDDKGETAALAWRVYTTSDEGRLQSKETRQVTFTTLSNVVVESLIAPEKDEILYLKKLTEDVTFSWTKPLWIGNENDISYTFVLDTKGGDFSRPVYTVDVKAGDQGPAPTSVVVTREKLTELYNASKAAATADLYELRWGVFAKLGSNVSLSKETRAISIIPKKKVPAFAAGEALYINIPGSSEDGQLATYIDDKYYEMDDKSWHDRADNYSESITFPYYEIFTQLKKGEKYSFYTLFENEKGRFFKADAADGFVETEEEAQAQVEVAEDGIYRIRFKTDGKVFHMRKVEWVSLRFGWGAYGENKYTDAMMNYVGKGVWNLTSYNIKLRDMGYKEDRYRLVMKFTDWDNPQGLSQNTVSTGNRPEKEQNASYWNVHLSYMGWDTRVFKYPAWLCDDGNLSKWCADVNLYMNADKGHYTHEFVNPVETKAFAEGDPLYIDGKGSEAGQKMSYITADSYNLKINKAGEADAFKGQDYKYEIFTKLEKDSKFYFRTVNSSDIFTLNAAGTEIKKIADAADAEGTVAAEGIYRIRFNTTSGKAYIAPIDKVEQYYCWNERLTPLTYQGKGVWMAKDLHIQLERADWGVEERYKFKFTISGQPQPFGTMSTFGNRPTDTTGADYWYVQPSVPDRWDPSFKYPAELCDENNLSRWYADLYLYMNDDKGHYTHEFKNAHE